ncbi:MAG TPA: thiolase family protein [Candidatus Pacearchaeota archaeon]|nr:thiolase family protein [Candidatus Pacearchaeota archaeon]
MFVKGVGMTKFDYAQKPWWAFAYEAAMDALQDAHLTMGDIDMIIFSSMASSAGGEHQTHKASLLSDLFKTNIPILEIPSVCGGGGVVFWTALHMQGFKNILVLAAEHLVNNVSEITVDNILSAAEKYIEQKEGMLFPTQNALVFQQYLQKYQDTTIDDLSLIAYKNHQNAVLNPKAYYYKRPVEMENIKKSPIVASPLRAFDCSLSVNGGAAVIVSQDPSSVEVIGSGFATDYILTFGREDFLGFRATRLAADQAFSKAKIKREDINVAEIHDAFTSVELLSYEDLGFVPKGKGAELIRSGKINLDGEMPVNPSGGLKAKGHPISATGLAQIYEITKQLRGECGERQVANNPKIGLTHNIGGAGGTVTVHILKKR